MPKKLLLLLLFILINSMVYIITTINKKGKQAIVLEDNLNIVRTHYKILLETQKRTARAVYQSTTSIPEVLEILQVAGDASVEQKAILRAKMHNLLHKKYEIIKQNGVLQYHFVLPNNESFYRAHKPEKFGDDLTSIRLDFKYTNKTHKPIDGFSQGRTAHGFRNIFPIFSAKKEYLGAMEVSFSSENFQWYLNHLSNIHSHFLVKKTVFNAKAWDREDLVLKYTQSSESDAYMLALGDLHDREKCIIENRKKLQPIREEIDTKIALGDSFASFVRHQDHVDVISFLAIKDINGRVTAWIVSYENSKIIEATFRNTLVIRIVTLLISLMVIYFLLNQIRVSEEIEKKNSDIKKKRNLLNDILNSTDNIMMITDFKDVKFANDKFMELLNVEDTVTFNRLHRGYMLDIFSPMEGCLNVGLLQEGERFVSLISRTAPENRVVSIFDKNFELRLFKISISKTKDNEDYLVTLSEITQMKARQMQIEKKAYIDGLTQVYNRNKFDEIFKEEIKNTKRYHTPLSIAILDIDKFKEFNDTYGHLIGDEVLIRMAQTVNHNVRETDLFARWGGEEFVVLFKSTTALVAKEVSEKLKAKIEANTHPLAGKITASFGVTEYQEGDTMESIFARCDKALYLAKENGRNRVEILLES